MNSWLIQVIVLFLVLSLGLLLIALHIDNAWLSIGFFLAAESSALALTTWMVKNEL